MGKLLCKKCRGYKWASELSETKGLCQVCAGLDVCSAVFTASTQQETERLPNSSTDKNAPESANIVQVDFSLTALVSRAGQISTERSPDSVRLLVSILGVAGDKAVISVSILDLQNRRLFDIGIGEFAEGECFVFPPK